MCVCVCMCASACVCMSMCVHLIPVSSHFEKSLVAVWKNACTHFSYRKCSDFGCSPDGVLCCIYYRQVAVKICGINIEVMRCSPCSRMVEKSAIFIAVPSKHGLTPTFVPPCLVFKLILASS